GVDARTIEKRVAQLARCRLERAVWQRLSSTLADESDSTSCAELGDLVRHELRPIPERVVVMRGDDVVAGLAESDQEGGGIGPAGHGDHGGAGWTRTSDNAIMSRALYHLSYGTAARA